MEYKLLSINKSINKKKKLDAIFENNKTKRTKKVSFGSAGMDDYTITKDKEQRDRYRKRHAKDLKTNDPTRAGYLSYYILWGDSTSRKTNITSYKKRFKL
tara:strand:- start:70 stop:369 length:300 start_codon:yes stop_codon:yes gene_type:complete